MPCSPGMRKCGARCLHRAFVQAYRDSRQAYEDRVDDESIGYATERAEIMQRDPGPTFRQWLIDSAGARDAATHDVA